MKTMLPILLGVSLALSHAKASAQPAAHPIKIDIESQILRDALNEWAQQTGFQLVSPSSEVTSQFVVSGVKGTLSAQAALEQLLAGTRLTYGWISERVVVIRSDPNPTSVRWRLTGNDAGLQRLRTAGFVSELPGGTVLARSSPVSADSNERGHEHPTKVEHVEEVVVTGSHLRGIRDSPVSLQVYDREYIQKTGYSSTQQFIRSLAQNFAGGQAGASEDGQLGSGSNLSLNLESATGINLRGLGTNATLVLVNGHRVANSATGTFADVSLIPLSAIERIEVLSEGASALYGADAVAGVVNFILRDDYDGAETSLQYGSVTDGPLQESTIGQTFGRAWSTGSFLGSLQYQDRDALRSSDRQFTIGAPQVTDIVPEYSQYSALVSVRGGLTDSLGTFFDGQYARKKVDRNFATAAGGQATSVDIDHASVATGLSYALPSNWRAEISVSYGDERSDVRAVLLQPLPGYTNGQLYQTNEYELTDASIKADGPLFAAPGGDVRMALGGSYRDERFSAVLPWIASDRQTDRSVKAAFAELHLPILAPEQGFPLAHRLSLSAAVRRDDYSDFGSTTNPKFAAVWSLHEDFDLRASYGTSFRAPNPAEELIALTRPTILTFPVAAPDGGLAPIFIMSGSKSLLPERSHNFTTKLHYHPRTLEGMDLYVGYYRIRFRDRVSTPPLDSGLLLHPDVYGSLITPLADDASAQSFLSEQIAAGSNFFDLVGTGSSGIRWIYDARQQNAALVEQRGIDVGGALAFSSGANTFTIGLNAAFIDEIETAFSATSTSTDIADTYGNPLRLRARVDLGWSRDPWQLNAAVNYAGRYSDISAFPTTSVGSYTTVDVNLRIMPAAVRGLTLSLNVINAFDTDPPYVQGFGLDSVHYDVGNADPIGRFISVGLAKKW